MTGRKEGLEGLNSPYATLSNLGYPIPLVLKVSGLGIPLINFSGDRVKGHDLFHEGGGDSSSEKTDEDVVVNDSYIDSVTLKSQDVTFECGGELSILLDHLLGR